MGTASIECIDKGQPRKRYQHLRGHLSFDTTERKPGLKPRRDSVLSDVQRQHFHAINQDNHPRVIVYD